MHVTVNALFVVVNDMARLNNKRRCKILESFLTVHNWKQHDDCILVLLYEVGQKLGHCFVVCLFKMPESFSCIVSGMECIGYFVSVKYNTVVGESGVKSPTL